MFMGAFLHEGTAEPTERGLTNNQDICPLVTPLVWGETRLLPVQGASLCV